MYCISTKDEEKFSPLILFNVTSLDGQNIQEVIADTGAGISAITRTLAHEIGAVIENQSGRRRIWQANGTEFSYTGQTKIAIKIEGEIFSINCFVFEELAFDLIIGNNVLKTRQAVVWYNPKENEQLFLAADNGRIVEVTGSSGDLGWKVRNVAFLLRSARNYWITPGESKEIEVEIVEWDCYEMTQFHKNTILLIAVNLMSNAIQAPRAIIGVQGDGTTQVWVSNFSVAPYQILEGEPIANAVLASSQLCSIQREHTMETRMRAEDEDMCDVDNAETQP